MNMRAVVPDSQYVCLACDALNANVRLHEEEGFKYVRIQASLESAVTEFVARLNRLLNKIRCTVCVQRDAISQSVYWLSFRFFKIDRNIIRSILSAETSKVDWIRHITSELGGE